jgi:hypothetical protein
MYNGGIFLLLMVVAIYSAAFSNPIAERQKK